jgi:hypothetical protein
MQNTKTMSDTEPAKKGFTQLVQKDLGLHSAGPEGFAVVVSYAICFCIENT